VLASVGFARQGGVNSLGADRDVHSRPPFTARVTWNATPPSDTAFSWFLRSRVFLLVSVGGPQRSHASRGLVTLPGSRGSRKYRFDRQI